MRDKHKTSWPCHSSGSRIPSSYCKDPGFSPRVVHVEFLMHKVTVGRSFIEYIGFILPVIVPTIIPTYPSSSLSSSYFYFSID
jgi:hypothetical protein